MKRQLLEPLSVGECGQSGGNELMRDRGARRPWDLVVLHKPVLDRLTGKALNIVAPGQIKVIVR
jgi:hypothetical protein